MQIVNITPTQYKNYAVLHNTKSFGQTVEYSYLAKNKLFLGLTDNSNNIYAAVLLIIKNISPRIKEAYAKDGFIIDYKNSNLLKTFTIELKKYLKKEKITYLITNPKFTLRSYNKNHNLLEDNSHILNTFTNLGYITDGYNDDFSKYDIIIENNKYKKIYNNFSRTAKRKIKDNLNMGITLHKGNTSDVETFYDIIKKKTDKKISYYYNLMNTYNSNHNKMDIFFTKLNPQSFLESAKKAYEKEYKRNEKIYKSIQKNNGKMDEKTLNKKIISDVLLEKQKNLLNQAISFSRDNKESIIIGTCITIKNNKEINFLIDGYNEKYRDIYSNHLLKWAIIKKYSLENYKRFNLGEIHKDYKDSKNKYHGQYQYKISFGGKIVEYSPNLVLIINNPLYFIYKHFYKQRKKS